MGRISDIIPRLYFTGKNNLEGFLDALDVEVDGLEAKVKGITDLVDVDRCPDDKLPYLAALTNCPLVGEDTAMWRRQLRVWPYLLKIKGTAHCFEVYLNSIGALDHRIPTYFRDADGEYVEEKPEGDPFLAEDGLWRNIRTHYFGLETMWDGGYVGNVYLKNEGWHDDFLKRIDFWMKRLKPFHAELLTWSTYIHADVHRTITVGTATAQGIRHDIDIAPHREGTTELNFVSGTATVRRGTHSIGLARHTEGIGHGEFVSGTVAAQGIRHTISIRPHNRGTAETLKPFVSTVVSRRGTQEVKLKQRLTGLKSALTWRGAVACGIRLTIGAASVPSMS